MITLIAAAAEMAIGEDRHSLLPSAPLTYSFHAPFLIAYRSSKPFILATICLALFTDSFIYGVLVPVLPFMLKSRCHIPDGSEQLWTSILFAAFGTAILLGSPICGWYADRVHSRQLPLLLGLPVLAGATILIGASRSVWVLLVSRLLQGFSTAVTWTVGLALTKDTAGKEEVGQWMGIAMSASSVGLIVSPLLGGIVFNQTGIWGILALMAALVILNAILVGSMIEKRVAQRYVVLYGETPDDENAYGTFHSDMSDETSDCNKKKVRNTFSAAQDFETSDTASSVNWEEEAGNGLPGLPRPQTENPSSKAPLLILLSSPRILTGAYGVFTQFGLLASFDAFLPLFVRRRFGWGSLGAGLIFLNIAIPALCGPLAGKISDRYGPRRVALAGCVLTAPPLFLLRLVGYDDGDEVVLLCALLITTGLFLTLIISPLAADLSFAVDQMEADQPGCFGEKGAYAQAYALFNCAMAAATVAGPMVAGALQSQYGIPGVSLVLGFWSLSAALPVMFFIGDGNKIHVDVEQPLPRRISVASFRASSKQREQDPYDRTYHD